MNDSEYGARWRILAAQLRELERVAGLGDSMSSRRDEPPPSVPANEFRGDGTGIDHPAIPAPAPLDAAQRRELRAAYFGVAHLALRRNLMAKQRELELFERTGARTRFEEARRHLDSIRHRPSEGWWIAAIVGATLVIVGYVLFALAGAIAGGVAALFVGNGIEQGMRRRFEQAVRSVEEEAEGAQAAATVAEQSRDVFSEREGATGEADETAEVADGFRVRSF